MIDADIERRSFDLTHFFNAEVAFFSIAGTDGYFKRSNAAFERMLGWSENELLGRSFYELVHPEDIPICLAQLAEVERTGHDVTFEARFLHHDGDYRWLAWAVQAGTDKESWYATARDVSEQHDLRDALEQIEQRLRMAMSVSEAGSWDFDVTADVLMLDPSASVLFGLPLTGYTGPFEGLLDRVAPEDREALRAIFAAKGVASIETDARVIAAQAAGRQVALRGKVISTDRRGRAAHAVGIAWDVTARKQVEAQLLDLVMNDQLTGLRNRRNFDQELRSEWRRAARSGESLAVLMLDVDNFKAVNDTLGHQAGDRYLTAVGRALANADLPDEVTVARYGGEEFVVLLPACGVHGAIQFGERLRTSIAELRLTSADGNGIVTVSVGAASIAPAFGARPEDLVRRADEALYRAKTAGKNRVVAAEAPTDTP